MPEDAGKKKFIKDFLQRVKAGEGFIEDIWIERVVRLPASTGEASTARSLSGRPISNITELLEDDLRHTFDDGYFTFRFVAALVGSGKTSLLTYLHELTKAKLTYESFSVVSRFQLSDLLMTGGNQAFTVKLYCYILARTFWALLNSSSQPIKDIARNILNDYLEQSEVSQLTSATKFMPFRSKFSSYFAKIEVVFEEFFFEVINQISRIEPRFTFAYLIDELDSLQSYPNELQETRSLIKALIKRASQKFRSKIRLLIYLVGTSNNIESFINEDSVIESLVGNSVINLNKGYGNEFEMIRAKIDARIEGAFKGYKNFAQAWQEIQNIPLNPAHNLRRFCQEYATAVLQIHEKHFREEPEKSFEGNARDLVKAQCEQKWQTHLNKKSYALSSVSTTTVLEGHAFDCYIELRHNNACVARAFGEAKNYELLSGHLETFNEWLEDVKFKPSTTDNTPPDLAFIIAPSCPSLLQRKLELKNICFIESNKVVPPVIEPDPGVDINTAEKDLIVNAFKGTAIKKTTIDRLMQLRSHKNYKNLDELAADLKLTQNAQQKLQKKVDDGKICFSAPTK
ncbi:hypothetical protein [Planktothrix agardhii]|jgi:hypothetical protein|uniref:Uncharacterized protein n=1 Tax=Planktothrix agardhii TaxID=1160 RepID=A0A1J1JBV6_PLAAG|nr:hypothetical protein [Planktothrix agardhii]MCB8786374.1 hypothetical protein [Planktothrix agardhii 1025]MCF3611983.1 hypothetical protein [Planktothrix agardhii 1027]MCF3645758.1 hypothetical protein [Planktothrix agardhii 1026]CAD5910644.1 hypothetical protein NO2A_00438 [Planktothrix agardhii]CAD5973143.1 hypothetical protein PANO66_04115 [Planktothrix agardhii]